MLNVIGLVLSLVALAVAVFNCIQLRKERERRRRAGYQFRPPSWIVGSGGFECYDHRDDLGGGSKSRR